MTRAGALATSEANGRTNSTPFSGLHGRLSDLQVAEAWAQTTHNLFYFDLPDGGRTAEWYKYKADGVNVAYLHNAIIDAHILKFIVSLNENGASVRVSPAKVRSVRNLAVLLRTETRHRNLERKTKGGRE